MTPLRYDSPQVCRCLLLSYSPTGNNAPPSPTSIIHPFTDLNVPTCHPSPSQVEAPPSPASDVDSSELRELTQASLLLHQLVEADELEEQQQQLAGLFGSKGGAVQPAGTRQEPAGGTKGKAVQLVVAGREGAMTGREQLLPGMSSPFRKGGAVAQQESHRPSGKVPAGGNSVAPLSARGNPAAGIRAVPALESALGRVPAVSKSSASALSRMPADGNSAAPPSGAPASLQPQLTKASALAPAMPTPMSGSALLLEPQADPSGAAASASSSFSLQSPCESTGSCAALRLPSSVGEDSAGSLAGTPGQGGARAEAVVMDELHVHTARSVTKQRSTRGMTGVWVVVG